MAKELLTTYTFDASAQTITFPDHATGDLELGRFLLIWDNTRDTAIFSVFDSTKYGSLSTNVLTLDHDTTGYADGDDLAVWYDSGGLRSTTIVTTASTNLTAVSSYPTTIKSLHAWSIAGVVRWVKIFNKASGSVNLASDSPIDQYVIPANTGGAGIALPVPREGIRCTTACSFTVQPIATYPSSTACSTASDSGVSLGRV